MSCSGNKSFLLVVAKTQIQKSLNRMALNNMQKGLISWDSLLPVQLTQQDFFSFLFFSTFPRKNSS